jgi:hypothetical protein
MLLEPVRIKRPDLRAEVRDLVELVADCGAGHEIPLTELVRILGITIAADFHQQLADRGDLRLQESRFVNRGPVIKRKVRLVGFDVTLRIPERLTGRLTRFHDSFQLAFEPDHSVAISKFLFSVQLRHLDLNRERIFVDFAGAQDVFIDLA